MSPFQLLYGVEPQVSDSVLGADYKEADRRGELLQSNAARASHGTENGVQKRLARTGTKFKVRDLVFFVREPDLGSGRKLEAFSSKEYGPCAV